MHGWGTKCAGVHRIINYWTLTVCDKFRGPKTFKIDIMEGESQVIIGLDVKSLSEPKLITTKS